MTHKKRDGVQTTRTLLRAPIRYGTCFDLLAGLSGNAATDGTRPYAPFSLSFSRPEAEVGDFRHVEPARPGPGGPLAIESVLDVRVRRTDDCGAVTEWRGVRPVGCETLEDGC